MSKYLPIGFELKLNNGTYTIKEVLGHGGSCVAYLASSNGQECIVKEFLSNKYNTTRSSDGFLVVDKSERTEYQHDLERFMKSSEIQKQIRNVSQTTNNTPYVIETSEHGYICVTCQSGNMFDKFFNNLSYSERLRICLATANYVKNCHDTGYLCLDIKPTNIFVLNNTFDYVLYIDFDSIVRKRENFILDGFSYTPNWSAKELNSPYEYNKISEKSDVYALGELVFFSLFERNSEIWEHRSFSNYPFEEIPDNHFISNNIKQNLTKLFRGTLLSSAEDRFSSVDIIIDLLKKTIDELSKQFLLITGDLRPDLFFVGRSKEIYTIEDALKHDDLVLLYGIDGIGKSDIIKNFSLKNENKYTIIYLAYNSSLVQTICDNTTFQISEINRFIDETAEHFAARKLDKLAEVIEMDDKKVLLIFDDFNISKNELADNPLWKKILAMNAKVLIATNIHQDKENAIEIGNLSIEELVQVFKHHCGTIINDNKIDIIEKIINEADNHTLLVELLAKHMASESIDDPEIFYNKLVEKGVFGLKKNEVTFNKRNESVEQHIRRLFDIDNLTYDEMICLCEMQLMPVNGVSAYAFCEFWRHENNNALNNLISKGWIKKETQGLQYIILNRILRSFVMCRIKLNEELSKQIFWEFRLAMLRNYDGSGYKSFEIDHLLKISDYSKENLENMMTSTDISHVQYKFICNSVAHEIINNNYNLCVTGVLLRYLLLFEKYGQYEFLLSICERLFVLLNNCQKDLFDLKVKYIILKVKLGYDSDELLQSINSLILKSKEKHNEEKNNELALLYSIQAGLLLKEGRISKSKRLNFKGLRMLDYRHNEKPDLQFFYMYAENRELLAEYYYSFGTIFSYAQAINQLEFAIKSRSIIKEDNELNTSENSIYIAIDKAKIHIIKNEPEKAQKILLSIIGLFVDNEYCANVALPKALVLLAELELNSNQLNEAYRELKSYMASSKQLEYYDINDMVKIHFIMACLYSLRNDEFNSLVQLGSAVYYEKKRNDNSRIQMIKCKKINDKTFIYSINGINHKIVNDKSEWVIQKMGEVFIKVKKI